MCSVCDEFGKPGNCPCCSPEPHMITCAECDGTGYTYYNENEETITQEEYNQCPPEKRDREPCQWCEGNGEITYNNQPENYNYDE